MYVCGFLWTKRVNRIHFSWTSKILLSYWVHCQFQKSGSEFMRFDPTRPKMLYYDWNAEMFVIIWNTFCDIQTYTYQSNQNWQFHCFVLGCTHLRTICDIILKILHFHDFFIIHLWGMHVHQPAYKNIADQWIWYEMYQHDEISPQAVSYITWYCTCFGVTYYWYKHHTNMSVIFTSNPRLFAIGDDWRSQLFPLFPSHMTKYENTSCHCNDNKCEHRQFY